jgi:CBS domain-containing protein
MIPPKEFIKKIRPFSFLSEEELDILMSGLEVDQFRKGRTIYEKGRPRKYVYIVFSGLVGLFEGEVPVDYLSRGEVFGSFAVVGGPYALEARAVQDTVCYLFEAEKFQEVFDRNDRFSSFFLSFIARRFRTFKEIALRGEVLDETAYISHIDKALYKDPVVCGPDTIVEQAVSMMDSNCVSSIIVVDGAMKPIGIFTHKDLRRAVIACGQSGPISQFMSHPVKTRPHNATLFDALTEMIESGINHLAITKEDKIFGVITRKDVQIQFEPSSSMISQFRRINKAMSMEELEAVYRTISLSMAKLAMNGPNFYSLSVMISSIHDAIINKVINLIDTGLPAERFVWVHMGGLGRKEEILATDQDNALIHSGGQLSEFAEAVVEGLDRIGIPKCTGNYMASHPKWNQSLSAWRDYFRLWFSDPVPEHVRYLTVFLDMRPVCGDEVMFAELAASIRGSVTDHALKLLASDAVEIEPPLGILGIRGLSKGVNLKRYGIYPIVNGVRVLAINYGMMEITNTKERLDALSEWRIIGKEMCHDLLESYGFLQDLRLRLHSISLLTESKPGNLVTAEDLSKVDLLILKESLKVISSFQKLLMRKYNVKGVDSFSPF